MTREWSVIFPIVLLPLLFHWMPLWRRNGIWFGVTVAPGYADGPDARRVLHRFRIVIWLLALAAAGMGVLGAPAEVTWVLAAAVTLEIGGALAAFAYARHQTLPHAVRPSSERSASLTDAPEGMPGGIFAVLVPFAILAAAALYLSLDWSRIPERWSARTWQSVYMLLTVAGAQCGLMLLIGLGILRASPRGRVAANAAASAQFRRTMLQFLVAATWGVALLVAAVAVARVAGGRLVAYDVPMVISLALVALALVFAVRIICINRTLMNGGDGTPDQCWKLGFFYFNPADPAIFVEKRFGIGYTCNFGNGTTWLFLGLLVILSLTPILLRYL
jgi:hypothetical protein